MWWSSPATSTASTPSTSSKTRLGRRLTADRRCQFAVGSITSPGSDALGVGRQVRGNSGLVRGYSVVTLTPDQVRCDNWGFDDIHLTERSLPEERWLAGFTSNAGRPQLLEADGPS